MRSYLRKIGTYIFIILGLIISLLIVLLLILFIRYPDEYIVRVLKWRDADVYDYMKFPERILEPPPETFIFTENIDESYIRQAFREAAAVADLDAMLRDTKTQAFIVIKNDTLLYEKYFNNTQRHSIVTSFSVAKSFASALVGKAIDEGYLSDVNDPITKYIPELAERDGRFRDITIRHLIMMSTGIKYKEYPFGDDAKTYYYTDLRKLAVEHTSIERPPGEHFHYNNYNPLLLGILLERATGMTITDYLQRTIWHPLGMEFPGSWSIDSESSGFEKMESGLNARAIDFAKFGRLYLQRGDGYDYSALGNHGQYIYISPKSNLIIVRHGERYGRSGWLRLFYEVAGYMADQ
jgi:CubicO group peptidase (beta-lactamase class C family)